MARLSTPSVYTPRSHGVLSFDKFRSHGISSPRFVIRSQWEPYRMTPHDWHPVTESAKLSRYGCIQSYVELGDLGGAYASLHCQPSQSDTGKVCNHGPMKSTITNDFATQ